MEAIVLALGIAIIITIKWGQLKTTLGSNPIMEKVMMVWCETLPFLGFSGPKSKKGF